MSVFALFFLLVILAGFLRCTKHISGFRKFLKMSRTEQEIEIALANKRLQFSHLKHADYSKEFWWLPLFLSGALVCAACGYWISAVWLAIIFTEIAEKTIRETVLIKIAKQKDRNVLDGFVTEVRMAY